MAKSNAGKAMAAYDAAAEALAELGPVAAKFGHLPERMKDLANSVFDHADETIVTARHEAEGGKRDAEAFIAQISEFWEEDIAELETAQGRIDAAERRAQESDQKLADQLRLQAEAPPPAAPQAPIERRPAPAYVVENFRRDMNGDLYSFKLKPKGDLTALGYSVQGLRRDGNGDLHSFNLVPETAH